MKKLIFVLLIFLIVAPCFPVVANPEDLTVNIWVEGEEVAAYLSINATKSTVVVDGVEIQEELERITTNYMQTRKGLKELSDALQMMYDLVVNNDSELAEEILNLKEQVDYVREFTFTHEKDLRTLAERTRVLAIAAMILHDNLTMMYGRLEELDDLVSFLLEKSDSMEESLTELETKVGSLEIIIEDHGKALDELKREQYHQEEELKDITQAVSILAIVAVLNFALSILAIRQAMKRA
ncbi:MAG: hypothetical protein DRN92_02585 [Thermoproteota archaeon]|nr:MAG: hypothetical protein DRN92_02585 [Candidatus Korarchaeota archaeon]